MASTGSATKAERGRLCLPLTGRMAQLTESREDPLLAPRSTQDEEPVDEWSEEPCRLGRELIPNDGLRPLVGLRRARYVSSTNRWISMRTPRSSPSALRSLPEDGALLDRWNATEVHHRPETAGRPCTCSEGRGRMNGCRPNGPVTPDGRRLCEVSPRAKPSPE